ncbi:MAG: putative quinol monooxygenase [Asticcacaulis sp.]
MSAPVKVIALLTARPGKAEALHALLSAMTAPSRAEPGNLRYDLWQDRAEPARFVLDELYTDDVAVAAHRATPHFQTYLAAINDLAERTAFVLDPLHIA